MTNEQIKKEIKEIANWCYNHECICSDWIEIAAQLNKLADKIESE